MIRKLLVTTALVSALSTAAIAQSEPVANPDGTAVFNRENSVNMSTGVNGYFESDSSEILTSSLLGKPIYNGTGEDAETIGDVNDVVMTADGTAKAVVIGVGGFLGIGEKEVAVDFDRVAWADLGDEQRLVIDTTVDELNAAPAFDRSTLEPNNDVAMAGESGMTGDTDMSSDMVIDTDPAPGAVPMADDAATVDYATLTAQDVIGAEVYDGEGDVMGSVSDAILADDSKTIEAYIVDIGGFLGIGAKPVALAADTLVVAEASDGALSVHTAFTEEQLANQPTYSEEAYAKTPDLILVR